MQDASTCELARDLALRATGHWIGRARLGLSRAASGRSGANRVWVPPNTSEILHSVGIVSTVDYCLCLMSFDGDQVWPMDDFTHHCNADGLATIMQLR